MVYKNVYILGNVGKHQGQRSGGMEEGNRNCSCSHRGSFSDRIAGMASGW